MANVEPGIHPHVEIHRLTQQEESIIRRIAEEQYVTKVSDIAMGSRDQYRYLLFKPADNFAHMFNLQREVALVISPFADFQPRVLEAFSEIAAKEKQYRVDPLCAVLVSSDDGIEEAVTDLISADPEAQAVVPFTIEELLKPRDSHFFRNRFVSHLFSRDLFSVSGPLKKDIFFYGRQEIINSIASHHKASENSGLFGLRRTGKTSVAFGVQRQVQRNGSAVAFVDCQSSAFNQQRWYGALRYVLTVTLREAGVEHWNTELPAFTAMNAGELFETTIRRLHQKLTKKTLIIFDEIENITFRVSPVPHWETGPDFIFFWQTVRSAYQTTDAFTFLIVGTNPTCVEIPSVNGKDNPIFNQIPFQFIPGFTVQQTRQMVRKLGRIMGLRFDEQLYARLNEDFGGHPFLIRQVCSVIHSIADRKRPVDVDRSTYEAARQRFNADSQRYISMILDILLNYYNDEYQMLRVLASEDYEYFDQLAESSPDYIRHLMGYGIVEHGSHRYMFRIQIVKDYLNLKDDPGMPALNNEDRLAEISKRRNRIEPNLRRLVKQLTKSSKGERKGWESIVHHMSPSDQRKVAALSYNDLFDPNKAPIYFRYLVSTIEKNWGIFQHVFTDDKTSVLQRLNALSRLRKDAHAADVTDEEVAYIRLAASAIERDLDSFF